MSKKKDIELEHKPKSAWEVYSSKKHMAAMDALADKYIGFLSRCKTERLVMDHVREQVEAEGFSEDFSRDAVFRLQRGKAGFIARKGKRPLSEGFRLIGAHADCPRLDLKQNPLYEDTEICLAKTHYYGGIRKYQWLTSQLALHGVVVKKDGAVVPVVVGEASDDPVLTITDLLPHLAYKEVEKKVGVAFEAEKLNIVLGQSPLSGKSDDDKKGKVKKHILKLLNDRYGITESDFFSAELQIVPAGPARYVGLDSSLIGGYGHDDRSSVFCALEAILAESRPEYTQIALFWDKEEIGSDGATGAKSLFFEYTLEDLIDSWEPGTKLSRVMLNGTALSADVAGAVDPDFKDVSEERNSAYLGYGPCFNKFTGHRGKVGANDAHPEFIGWLRRILDDAGIPWQMSELGKVDAGGGGTVAKFLAVYGMDIIDVGAPVLSMHSPFELTTKADMYATTLAFREFFKN